SSEITVWMVGSATQKRLKPTRACPMIQATPTPSTNPTPESTTNCQPAVTQLKAPVTAAATANLNATSPDASLIRLCPFKIVVTREGTLSFKMIALTETASGGETTAPSANAAANGSSGTSQCSTYPTTTTVSSTSPNARSSTGRIALIRSRLGMSHPSEN